MGFIECVNGGGLILMEGALGERLRHEYGIAYDPYVALASLVYGADSNAALRALWSQYIQIAFEHSLPFLATTPTRRANSANVRASRFDDRIIHGNVALLRDVQRISGIEMYAGGLVGCRGDAYTGEGALARDASREFHSWEVQRFAEAGIDFIFAGIMPALDETVGMALAISDARLPYIISFMLRKDGRLIDGTPISDAISEIDDATPNPPVCYMTNCVHPANLHAALSQPINDPAVIRRRFLGIQANASPLSPEELDGSSELRSSTPESLAADMLRLRDDFGLRIFGGCCGTVDRHMRAIADAICHP